MESRNMVLMNLSARAAMETQTSDRENRLIDTVG